MSRMVVGCVYGAWKAIQPGLQRRGDRIPTYEWCEQVWQEVLRKRAPAPPAVPLWLQGELWSAWMAEMAGTRVKQLSLDLDAAARPMGAEQ